MDKLKFIEKNYIYVCFTFIGISIYVIFFPIVAKVLNLISPELTKCVYKSMTGNPCPLCGGTRYIANLKEVFNNPSYLLHPFGFMIIFIIFEILFRIFCIFAIRKKKKYLNKLVVIDVVIHLIVFISFITYEVLFILNT